MESIHHFSHDKHPLFLKKFGENEEEKEFVCKGCGEQITEKDNYYACPDQECSWFYLHKKCADLPREINLPIHQHPLTLFASSPYKPGLIMVCDMCQRDDWKWFTYHCSLCHFDIDVICSSLLLEGKMESIHHFSHSKHPLFLKKFGENEEEKEFVCYGCQQQITEKDNYYACRKEWCSFYLHKKCANLPREINLPIHQHPLTLLSSFPSYYYGRKIGECSICQRDWKWFTYHCSLCKFVIDVKCSSLLQEANNILQHEGHPHPLTFNIRSSLFHCDACNTEDKDLSYFCNTCNFWIHKSCASAPKSIKFDHHDDPLFLAYSLPEQHLNFIQFCDICKKEVIPSNWVYYCDNCRYFNHLKCATSNPPRLITGESDTESSDQLMQLPFPNHESVLPDPTSLFVANKIASVAYDDGPKEISHWLHHHPISIITTKNVAYNDMICDGCVRPISAPFYSCSSKCNFFLHKFCAELPEELPQCPLDSGHSIKVKKSKSCYDSRHSIKEGKKNNFLHEGHPHPLTFNIRSSLFRCDACNTEDKDLSYFCNTCNFRIHKSCASAPKSIKVDHHDDPLFLAYSLPEQHQNFNQLCDICKMRVIPSNWVYYCDVCRYFNHLKCATSNPPRLTFWAFNQGESEIQDEEGDTDSGHSIKVKKPKSCYDYFQCSFCSRCCNGFLCECVSCNLKLDIGCASNLIASRIKHDSHGQHPLVRSYLPIHEENFICNACNDLTEVRCVYSCKACSFNLCIKCVNYPGSVRHEYDRHSIPLTYPPIKDHPSDFICEICEEDINPRDWMYHCKDCNQSFHTECLSPYEYSNVKFGGKVNIDKIHTHPLTYVRNIKSENVSLCGQCGRDWNGRPILECAPCGFKLCIPCAREFEA